MEQMEKHACLKVLKFSNRKKKKRKENKRLLKPKVCHATREPQSLEAGNKVNEAAASVDVLKQDFSTDRMSFFLWEKSENPLFIRGRKQGLISSEREEE